MKAAFRRTHKVLALGGLLLAGAVLTQGCLQREVKKQNPNTSNVFVEQIANTAINEIDLLFVIDNSVSMADKQEILKDAVPQMVERLVNPFCIDSASGQAVGNATNGTCPAGSAPEFNPVDDIHIGVITSSLGGHGASLCNRAEAGYNNDDQAHLIPSVRPGTTDPLSTGFLAWNGGDQAAVDALVANFSEHVAAAGEVGCGFEAPLEAWYRFLIDPQPPLEIVLDGNSRSTMATDGEGNPLVDGTVLAQREAFLRPEGLVAIVVLSDENDCSAMDGGNYYSNAEFGYLVAEAAFDMPVATAMCETNPNDPCCFSCLQEKNPPSGCAAEASICSMPDLSPEEDRANVRCFQNKRRFGVDLLYPTQRYVDALTKTQIIDARTGNTVDNPLLLGAGANAGTPRDPDLVFFAGIIGVPWQDVATDASLTDPNVMAYRTASELTVKDVDVGGGTLVNRWEVILGQPGIAASSKVCDDNVPGCGEKPVPPFDPFMVESIAARAAGQTNPISGDPIVDFTSNNPAANNINGHEANHQVADPKYADGGLANDDLQYACIFPLETPKEGCTSEQLNCDCGDEPLRNRPLCQAPGGGGASTTQYYGKAYPGTRILRVLRDFGANSIVGSICPKLATADSVGGDRSNPNYGYNPAVQAIVDRLAEKLAGKCLPRELTLDEEGNVPCEVVEVKLGENLNCDPTRGRNPVEDAIRESVLKQLESSGRCGGSSSNNCNDYSMCSINQVANTSDCFFNEGDPASFSEAGYCYIDPAKGPNSGGVVSGSCSQDNPDGWGSCQNPIVKNCPATERRLLRFVGQDTPVPDSITFVACTADAASSDAPIPAAPGAVVSMGGAGN